MRSNPFASKFIQPGQIPYFFEADNTFNATVPCNGIELLERFTDSESSRGAIVGPHGTGKSTLLMEMYQAALHKRIATSILFLNSQERASALKLLSKVRPPRKFLFIDGYEQLSWMWRTILFFWQSVHQVKIVATCHAPIKNFTTLWQTSRTENSEHFLVTHLLQDEPDAAKMLLASPYWTDSRNKHGANLRESLFDAYDWYESLKSNR